MADMVFLFNKIILNGALVPRNDTPTDDHFQIRAQVARPFCKLLAKTDIVDENDNLAVD